MKTMKMTGELLMTMRPDVRTAVLATIIADGQLKGEHDYDRSLWLASGEWLGRMYAMEIAADTVAWWWVKDGEDRPRELTVSRVSEDHDVAAEFARRCADLLAAENDLPSDPIYDILMAADENDPEAIEAAENCGLGFTREAVVDNSDLEIPSDAECIEECPECGHREESDGYGGNDCPECNEAMKVIRCPEGLVNTIDGYQWRNHDGDVSPLGS